MRDGSRKLQEIRPDLWVRDLILYIIWFNFNVLIPKKIEMIDLLIWNRLMLFSNMLQVKQVVSAALQFCDMCEHSKCAYLDHPPKTIVQFIKFIIYRIFNGRQPSLVIHDPELLKCVFVKNNHDFPNRRVRFLWTNYNLVGNCQC